MMAGVAAAAVLAAAVALDSSTASWPQWGGPSRDFSTGARPLALTWPDGGPKRLWRRALGDGFSSIVTDGASLYTLYRDGASDVVVAMDAATGVTRWASKYPAPFVETCSQQLGPAPRSAPLIDGSRLVTVSAGGLMNSFDRRSGKVLWTRDLLEGAPDSVRACGYSSSPLAYNGRIITTAGGKGRGVVALEAATGAIAWQAQDFENGYSSPILVDLDGRPELIVFTYADVAGLNPDTGALEWRQPHPADYGVNVATPLWIAEERLLFVSSAYNGGSRVLRLTRQAERVAAEEVWANKRVRIHFGNAVRIGGRIYASNGDFGAAPLAAVDVASGEMPWRDRSVARSTILAVGSMLLLLDEDGNLAIATPGPEGLTVHAKAPIADGRCWTAPTLSGTTLYVRNRSEILALDLGAR